MKLIYPQPMATLVVIFVLMLILTGCEKSNNPGPKYENTGGFPATATYLTTIKGCDIYEVEVQRPSWTVNMRVAQCAIPQSVAMSYSCGKGCTANELSINVPETPTQRAAREYNEALAKLTEEQKRILELKPK